MAAVRYTSFAEFYPYYLAQHEHKLCRRAHFVGTSSAIAGIAQYIDSLNPGGCWWPSCSATAAPGSGISSMSRTGRRPSHPWYSFKADWVMYWQMLTGKISW
jgi:hypothetical protein